MMIDSGSWSVEDLLLVGDDVVAQLDAGDQPHGRAGGDDQVVEGVAGGLAVLVLDVDPGRAGEGAPAVDLGDLVLLHQEVDALDDAGADVAAALVGRAERHRGVALDAELRLLVLERVRQLGVLQQRLGGDAADVEADTSPVLLLHHGHLLAELGCADRGDVATGAGAEDEGVEVRVGHAPSLVVRLARGTPGPRLGSLSPVTLYAAYGTNLDPARMSERCPHSILAVDGLADRLAADLRRRGARLGRRAVHDRPGPLRAGLRRGLRRHPRGRARRSTAGRPPTAGSTARPRSGCRR